MFKLFKRLIIGAIVGVALASIFMYASGPTEKQIKSKVVKLIGKGGRGSCSGEQVRAPSGVDYILTAAHCRSLEDKGSIMVQTEEKFSLMRKIIAEDPNSDLLLLEGLPNRRGLDIGDSLRRAERLRSFTHGGGMDTYKTEGLAIGIYPQIVPTGIIKSDEEMEVCLSAPKYEVMDAYIFKICVIKVDFLVTTVPVIPGSSGGPVVNSDGELVGVVSATDGGFISLLVTLRDIKLFLMGY